MLKNNPRRNRRDRSRDLLETSRAAHQILRSLGTSLARKAARCLESDHNQYVALEVNPSDYRSWSVFWRDWQAVQLLRKYPKLSLTADPRKAAIESFTLAETLCRETNNRLASRYDTPTLGISGDSLIETARLKISRLLGDFSWDDAEEHMRFTTGATTSRKRREGHPYFKYQGKLDVTRHAQLLGIVAIWRCPRWAESMRERFGDDPYNWVNVVPGNRVAFVAKNARTDRTIAIEPDLNMFLQTGIGGVIRRRLKTVSVDLNDQRPNQELARSGSIDGAYATLDLSMASDTVSLELVKRLMPPDWYEALYMTRSHVGTLPSGVCHYQKFSSMGNGYTFELESLIFWALASSVVDSYSGSQRRVVVFGDDIIVPTAASGFVTELLTYCGFAVNKEKSFEAGPFRESCGKHYFSGIDVTPFQIKKVLDNASAKVWLVNSVRRWASRPYDGFIADDQFKPLWHELRRSLCPSAGFIPDNLGDGGVASTFSEALPRKCRRTHGWKVELILSGRGRTQAIDGNSAYLSSVQRMRVSQPYDVLFEDYRGEVTAVDRDVLSSLLKGGRSTLPSVVVDREMIWNRRVVGSISQWHDAPMWTSI